MITYSRLYRDIAILLDREDLEQEIPAWVRMAEKQIYRYLRVRHNETVLTLVDTDDPISPITLPEDFKEMRLLVVDDYPLTRVSDARFKKEQFSADSGLPPDVYATINNQLYINNWPTETPTDGWPTTTKVEINYYREDAYPLLEMGEDAFLYGGAFHGAVSLKAPAEQRAMYEDLFSKALISLEQEHKKQEYAGSTVSVSSAYNGNIRHRSRVARV